MSRREPWERSYNIDSLLWVVLISKQISGMDVTATANADDAPSEPGPSGESECNESSFAFYQKKVHSSHPPQLPYIGSFILAPRLEYEISVQANEFFC